MNDVQDSKEAVGAPALLRIGERTFVLAAPTPDAELLIHDKNREIARRGLKRPLQQVIEDAKSLPPMFAEIVLREATALQSGAPNGVAEPTMQQMIEAAMTPEGLAFRVWVFARSFDQSVKLEEIESLVTEKNIHEVAIDLSVVTFGSKKKDGSEAGSNTTQPSGESLGPSFTES